MAPGRCSKRSHVILSTRSRRGVGRVSAAFSHGVETGLSSFTYLSRCTYGVAISNSSLFAFDDTGVNFRYKDYRRDGADRQQVMTISADEFFRRFLLHVLPRGFHRIRHYGLLASSARKTSLARARQLLNVAPPPDTDRSMNRLTSAHYAHAAAGT